MKCASCKVDKLVVRTCSCGTEICYKCILEQFVDQVRTIPIEAHCCFCCEPIFQINDAISSQFYDSYINLLCQFGCAGDFSPAETVVILNFIYHIVVWFEREEKISPRDAKELLSMINSACEDLGDFKCEEPVFMIKNRCDDVSTDVAQFCNNCRHFIDGFSRLYNIRLT